jgi:hypothetical protein
MYVTQHALKTNEYNYIHVPLAVMTAFDTFLNRQTNFKSMFSALSVK